LTSTVEDEVKLMNVSDRSSQGISSVGAMMSFLKQPRDDWDKMWKYWHTAVSLARRLGGARFCVTEHGYAGLGPFGVDVGHEVWVLHGMATPFAVGDVATQPAGVVKVGESLKELIGECYLHGLMYGEALDMDDVKEGTLNFL
jgi:hypothetical protein